MTGYWCVNFDFDECLQHGLQNNLWLMQQLLLGTWHSPRHGQSPVLRRSLEDLSARKHPGRISLTARRREE